MVAERARAERQAAAALAGDDTAVPVDLGAIQATLQALATAVAGGGIGITQTQIDEITGAINTPRRTAGTFSLTPGQVGAGDIIDYSTSNGIKGFKTAIKSLGQPFDHQLGKTTKICEVLQSRAFEAGWQTGAGDILTIPDAAGVSKDLLSEFGQLTMTDINAHCNTYHDTTSRKAQNSVQMKMALYKTLGPTTQLEMLNVKDQWSIGATPYGPMMFKSLMNKTIVDNNQTTRHLQDRFDELPNFMITCDSDLEKFHSQYREIVSLMKGRGITNIDTFKPLWRGYQLCNRGGLWEIAIFLK